VKVYFSGAIAGGRKYARVYRTIVEHLQALGHEVPSAHVAEVGLSASGEGLSPEYVYRRDVTWIQESDCLVAEVSTPSLGVGYEICYALGLGKPVLCLHQAGLFVSKMITGNTSPCLQTASYADAETALKAIDDFLAGQRRLRRDDGDPSTV